MAKAMPGAFHLSRDEDVDDAPLFHRPSGRLALFISPSASQSEARSSVSPTIVAASSPATATATVGSTRKRPRLNTSCDVSRSSYGPQPRGETEEPPSPAPLVNTDYRIAGGLDTPRAERARSEDVSDWEQQIDRRINRFSHQLPPPALGSPLPHTPQYAGEGCASEEGWRMRATLPTSGWGHTIWNLTSGVASKLIDLCWTTAFYGFHSGGGQGYHMQLDTPTITAADSLIEDIFDANFHGRGRDRGRGRGRGATPIPGEFPTDDFGQDYVSRLGPQQEADTPLQMAKDASQSSSLRRNWVIVDSPSCDRTSEGTSPVRKKARGGSSLSIRMSSSSSMRQMARPSHNTRTHQATPRKLSTGASYASPRGSPRPGDLSSYASPPSNHLNRSHRSHNHTARQHKPSYASPRQSEAAVRVSSMTRTQTTRSRTAIESSPKSPDVIRLEKKLRHEDRRQSDSIKRMNERMQILLREGQQALATKIEVSDPIDDEGYDDGGLCDEDSDADDGIVLANDDVMLEPTVTVPSHRAYVW